MVVILLLLLVIGLIRIFFPQINQFKAQFEQKASIILQQPVEIGAIEARWRGLLPVINFNNMVIYDKGGQVKLAQIQHVQLIPKVWDSLSQRKMLFRHLSLAGTKLSIRQLDSHRWEINGVRREFSQEQTNNNGIVNVLNWFESQGSIKISQVDLQWQGLNGIKFSANNTQLQLNAHNLPREINLNASNINFEWERFFVLPLQFDQLSIILDYPALQKNSELVLKKFTLINKDLEIKGRLKFNKNSDKFVQLVANFSGNNIALINNYIPKGLVKKGLLDWLRFALIKSDAYQGEVSLQGPIKQFPFANNAGQFKARVAVENLDLNYKKDWPQITNMFGNLLFDRASLQFDIAKAKMLGMPTGAIHGNILNLKQAVLNIHWKSFESYRNLIKIIVNSPLQKILGKTLGYIDYVGPSKIDIDLSIPIHKNNQNEIKVAGKFTLLPSGVLKVPAYRITLSKAQGILYFTEDTLMGKNLTGIWLGQPLTLDITTQRNDPLPTEIHINTSGILDSNMLGKNYNLPFLSNVINGKSPFKALLKFFTGKNQPHNIISISSDLLGLTVKLPEPFKKAASESRPSTIKIATLGTSRLLTLNYSKKASGIISLRQSKDRKWRIDRANIHIGHGRAHLSKAPSVIVEGNFPQVNVMEIMKQFSSNKPSNNSSEKFSQFIDFMGPNPKRIKLTFGQINILDMMIHKATIHVKEIRKLWKIKISSEEICGDLVIPRDLKNCPIQGIFQRFYLTSSITSALGNEASKVKSESINPGNIPSLNLFFKDFYYDNNPLGEICLITSREKNAMEIKEFAVIFPNFNLLSTGRWDYNAGKPLTEVDGEITTTSLGDFLKNAEITQSVAGGKGNALFHFTWEGPAYNPNIEKLNGQVGLKFKKGEILKVVDKPSDSGIGLILNLLTFEILKQIFNSSAIENSKKSDLDFRILSANLTMIDGNAYTDNILLDGEMAKVKSTGRIGLAARDYNLLVKVTPYIANAIVPGSSLPVIGNVIRASLAVVNKLVGSVLNRFFIRTYHITGPWAHPSFDRISNADAKAYAQ